MKWILFVLISVIIPACLIISCTSASKDQLIPGNTGGDTTVQCDTAGMRYTADVLPILQSRCYGCHSNGNTGGSGGINLDGYSNLLPYASSGVLAGVITHAQGYVPMPYGEPKLDDCSINKIIDWVNQGTPNN